MPQREVFKMKNRKRSLPKYERDRIMQGTYFLIPTMILVMLMIVAPLIYVIWLSFHEWNGSFAESPLFVGLGNYTGLKTMTGFVDMAKFSILYAIATTFIGVGLALILAFALDKPQRGKYMNRSLLRALWYVPALIGGTSVGIIWKIMYNYKNGLLNTIIKSVGGKPVNWLETVGLAGWAVIIAAIWAGIGMQIIIFLAGLQAIPQELYESATIDGANTWQQRIHIAIPLLAPSITINVITSSITAFKAYELPWVITAGLPGYTTRTVTQMIKEYGFNSMKYGAASALAVVLIILIVVIQLIQLLFLNKNEEEAYD